ncbi:Nramp family divalent metal transporter [Frondihabitans australicus]|uniref:Manganese transport protein n=1 Tax=Frondihabitans australicus TaxID=386892 RepID=A0A495IC92_9MICO|nr:Nramp family divalent metal transporter [Frondihabitans australicus]RKR72921.1 manganese transport protein [Frondihabitans australicus]
MTLQAARARPAPRVAALLGPAIVAGVAYLDPGNVASNMTAGALFGYLLVWVVLAGNATAWLIQYLSAKLGIATGASLPELLGRRIGRRGARIAFWLQAEVVAMATDIAEVIGGAIALNLLFGVPLLVGGMVTGVISLALLLLQTRGRAQSFERVVTGMVIVIAVGFCAGLVVAGPDWGQAAGGLVPRFEGSRSLLLAVSILGATIMPHAIYAHSALARDRFDGSPAPKRLLLRATRIDVTVALAVAGTVNVAILLVAAGTLRGVAGTGTLEGAYAALLSHLGIVVATLFAVGLLASGLASTSVGAYAGSEIMHGLLHVRVPILYRRLVTLVPALVLLGVGVDPTAALVISQVVLSFGIPFALVPLVLFTASRRVMGELRNRWWTSVVAGVAAAALIALNVILLVLVA